eukprot:3827571-Rhodomonas_salina.2
MLVRGVISLRLLVAVVLTYVIVMILVLFIFACSPAMLGRAGADVCCDAAVIKRVRCEIKY